MFQKIGKFKVSYLSISIIALILVLYPVNIFLLRVVMVVLFASLFIMSTMIILKYKKWVKLVYLDVESTLAEKIH
jgi:hypothetical protein